MPDGVGEDELLGPVITNAIDHQSEGNGRLSELVVENATEIGRGGQAVVYSGTWLGRRVAIKACDCHLWAEVENLQKLKHENIVQFLDVGLWMDNRGEQKFAVVLELCSRGSLGNAVRSEGHICWILWIKWLREIADGMCYLHSQKIIHRDLKTDNILITDEYVVRISDFGLSREKLIPRSCTVSTIVGTYCYMSPEMIRNEKYSNKVDIWSFGVVLWEMFTRRIPYEDLPPLQILYHVGTSGIQLKVPDVVPIQIQMLLTRCWNRQSKDRPAFSDVRDAVDIIYAEVCIGEEEWSECIRQCREECGVSTYIDVQPKACEACSKVHPQNIGWCTLYDAVAANDAEDVRAYWSHPFAEYLLETDKWGMTPLKKAVKEGYTEITAELLRAGANSDVIDNPMLETVIRNNCASILQLLMEQDDKIKETEDNGKARLFLAAKNGAVDVLSLLIEMGTDCKSTDKEKNAPIHLASQRNHVEVVRLLLENGVDVNMRGRNEYTPLIYAAENGAADVVRLLLEKGADCMLKTTFNHTAIHAESINNNVGIVRLLLEHGVDVNMRGWNDWTPLYWAACYGNADVVRLLLEKGADRSLKDKFGKTALDRAKEMNHQEVTMLLA